MWCSGNLEIITAISLSGTKCFYHFHSEKMFHNHRRACLQRCFIAVNILIANTFVEDQYCPVIIKMTKRLNHVDTSLISYSGWPIRQSCSPNIFPALAVQSVLKSILVAELFSVYVLQRLSVCILIINQMFGL